MAQQKGRSAAPVGSGSTNRSFATLDPERQGAPPRQKAAPARGARPQPLAPAPHTADPLEHESEDAQQTP